MSDELTESLVSELGFQRKGPSRAGLQRSIGAFLGLHLEQRTPIQRQAIEVIYDGADALLISATASGKTEAALIPIAARLLTEPGKTLAVYIAPTRALLNDLHRRLEAPLHRLGLAARVRHGDRALPAKTDRVRILFTTPESLDVLLSKNAPLLKRAGYVVLDEIHQIFGTARGDQLAFLLPRLECFAGRRIQRLALSATVGDPAEVANWLCPGREPARIIVAPGTRQIMAQFRWMSEVSLLRQVLSTSEDDKVLCFANSRRRCDDVYLVLRDLQPFNSYVHYSSLLKRQREYVERGFRSAQMAVCVATSTLELGIDIGSVERIVLADAPRTVDSFLQRIGRGGRRGQHTHVTVTPGNLLELIQFVAMLVLAENGEVEGRTAGRPYSVAIQQIFSIIAGKRRLNLHPDELAEQFEPLSWLTPEHIRAVLERLVRDEFLRRNPGAPVYEFGPELAELISRRQIFSNISGQSTGTPVFHSGRLLAYLPLRPNQIRYGNVILFAGRYWRLISISDRGLTVELADPVPNPVRPVWGSRGAYATSSLLARGMRDLLLSRPSLSDHQLDPECNQQLGGLYQRTAGVQQIEDAVWCERIEGKYLYHTFAGAIENQVLRLLFTDNGMSCEPVRRAEGVVLESKEHLHFDCVPDDPQMVTETVAAHWRKFAGWISSGPYFEYVPPALRRAETLARIAVPSVISKVTSLSGAETAYVDLRLF